MILSRDTFQTPSRIYSLVNVCVFHVYHLIIVRYVHCKFPSIEKKKDSRSKLFEADMFVYLWHEMTIGFVSVMKPVTSTRKLYADHVMSKHYV